MKRFLKYDTEIVKKENSPVDKSGVIKENIGGRGVQSNWSQLEESEPDFIKNKPFGLVKGRHLIDKNWLSLTFSNNVATATLNCTFNISNNHPVRVKIQISTGEDPIVYDDVPCVKDGYNPELAAYMYIIGGDGYPFTITNTQLTLDTTVFTAENGMIARLEVLDMSSVETVKIDSSYIPIDYIMNNIPSNYVHLKSNPTSANDNNILVYDNGLQSFVCRTYLTIESPSGKKFKLVANDSGELSTEEITS